MGTLRKPSLRSRRKKGLEGPAGAEIPAFPQFLCSSPRAPVYDCPGIVFFPFSYLVHTFELFLCAGVPSMGYHVEHVGKNDT